MKRINKIFDEAANILPKHWIKCEKHGKVCESFCAECEKEKEVSECLGGKDEGIIDGGKEWIKNHSDGGGEAYKYCGEQKQRKILDALNKLTP